jgi:hypothetical protein
MSTNAHVIHTTYMGIWVGKMYITQIEGFFFFDNLAGECMSGVRGEILESVWLQVGV